MIFHDKYCSISLYFEPQNCFLFIYFNVSRFFSSQVAIGEQDKSVEEKRRGKGGERKCKEGRKE